MYAYASRQGTCGVGVVTTATTCTSPSSGGRRRNTHVACTRRGSSARANEEGCEGAQRTADRRSGERANTHRTGGNASDARCGRRRGGRLGRLVGRARVANQLSVGRIGVHGSLLPRVLDKWGYAFANARAHTRRLVTAALFVRRQGSLSGCICRQRLGRARHLLLLPARLGRRSGALVLRGSSARHAWRERRWSCRQTNDAMESYQCARAGASL